MVLCTHWLLLLLLLPPLHTLLWCCCCCSNHPNKHLYRFLLHIDNNNDRRWHRRRPFSHSVSSYTHTHTNEHVRRQAACFETREYLLWTTQTTVHILNCAWCIAYTRERNASTKEAEKKFVSRQFFFSTILCFCLFSLGRALSLSLFCSYTLWVFERLCLYARLSKAIQRQYKKCC